MENFYGGFIRPGMSWKLQHAWEKDQCQQVEHIQVSNGTDPGVRRCERPLFARHTVANAMETSRNSVKSKVR